MTAQHGSPWLTPLCRKQPGSSCPAIMARCLEARSTGKLGKPGSEVSRSTSSIRPGSAMKAWRTAAVQLAALAVLLLLGRLLLGGLLPVSVVVASDTSVSSPAAGDTGPSDQHWLVHLINSQQPLVEAGVVMQSSPPRSKQA